MYTHTSRQFYRFSMIYKNPKNDFSVQLYIKKNIYIGMEKSSQTGNGILDD